MVKIGDVVKAVCVHPEVVDEIRGVVDEISLEDYDWLPVPFNQPTVTVSTPNMRRYTCIAESAHVISDEELNTKFVEWIRSGLKKRLISS